MDKYIRFQKPDTPLSGVFHLPVSKSELNRALVMAAFSKVPVHITGTSEADDCRVFIQYLRACGFTLDVSESGIHFSGQAVSGREIIQDLGMAGTALRFLPVLAACLPVRTVFTGAGRLSERPVLPLIQALQTAGAKIIQPENGLNFPLIIEGNPEWKPASFFLGNAPSSQLLSALLLAGAHWPLNTQIHCDKNQIVSRTYVDLTLQMLSAQGIHWLENPDGFFLSENVSNHAQIFTESDWSSASYAFGHVMLNSGKILLKGLKPHSFQGDAGQLDYFRQLGVHLKFVVGGLEVSGEGKKVSAFDFDFSQMPDLAQTFAVLALFADGPCILRGLSTLRFKETDRVQALELELKKCGADVEVVGAEMKIIPFGEILPVCIRTYADHRMAMAFALAAVRTEGMCIENPEVTGKSFPEYWNCLSEVGIKYFMQDDC